MNRLKAVEDHAHAVQQLQVDVVGHPAFHTWTIREQLDRLAQRLIDAQHSGDTAVSLYLRRTLPDAPIGAVTLATAREAVARDYGYADWSTAVRDGSGMTDVVFEAAVDAVVTGDLELLSRLLVGDPALVRARSAYAHRATLLHYLAANGVELYRQRVPSNATAVAGLLLAAGADPQATMPVSGGAFTLQELLSGSSDPVLSGVARKLTTVTANGCDRPQPAA